MKKKDIVTMGFRIVGSEKVEMIKKALSLVIAEEVLSGNKCTKGDALYIITKTFVEVKEGVKQKDKQS